MIKNKDKKKGRDTVKGEKYKNENKSDVCG